MGKAAPTIPLEILRHIDMSNIASILGEKKIRAKYPHYMSQIDQLYREQQVNSAGKIEFPIDPLKVPHQFHPLIPAAGFWGETDDGFRAYLVELAPTELVESIVAVYSEWWQELEEWLCGSEANLPDPSDEHVRFCCLSIAADFANVELNCRYEQQR
ncbi:hypothetical protein [Symmachiella dynata]|uniref:hypothetical protein n=1 Tax=Symmachiella dynata TaxID=2527995 RepID=UPI00119D9965|nr:hypothetical protein [Symmachiella dynata]